ncbi:MAG TPA: DUF1801 domain-containing protein [Saprospiraceae bacterium]|nr:DUF1801 domain-containing protein [Saprospiraceae bacterium]
MMNEIETYINSFPEHVQKILREIRGIIMSLAPDAVESMAYSMPAYKTNNRPLVYFAAYRNHIGLYALPSGHKEFEANLKGYRKGKGSVQFPLDSPIPFDLIRRIVQFRISENQKNNKF